MKRLSVLFAIYMLTFNTFAQDVDVTVFRENFMQIAKHPKITKTFSMIDEQQNFYLYVDVTAFDEFYLKEPIDYQEFKLFLWKAGEIGFYNIEQYVTLITLMQPNDSQIVYEFISQVDQKRFLVQTLFTKQGEEWQLSALKRTRIKMAKISKLPKF